ncbi:MAG: anhydro-N-acetylmuramic acid kinase [Planctomycetota bacterium]|nr:anhydro-N-acetylmuramic acid kinase [Planctomycetota bacterium]
MTERARCFVGLMSGTSADGIDAVAVSFHGAHGPEDTRGGGSFSFRIEAHVHEGFDEGLRRRVLALPESDLEALALIHVELGQHFGEAAKKAMEVAGWSSSQVMAVASPGLTAIHLPPSENERGATLSIGDGDVIAEVSGCRVLSDFRARDRAAGGHGAPLVPYADGVLLREEGKVRAALNLGGIANITVVPPKGPLVAFDVGPGNMVLDGALHRKSNGAMAYDENGEMACAGRVDQPWLDRLLAEDEFLSQPPPRSTGRERYGDTFYERFDTLVESLSIEDLAATLSAYTVAAIGMAVQDHVNHQIDEMVVSGGGALNLTLMGELETALAPLEVMDSERALGIPVLAKEALAFALIADASLAGIPASLPFVTGARRPSLLGKISPASPR